METTIYSAKGTKKGTITLPEEVFGVAWNAALMHQVVTSMQANARTPVAHVKDRGDVSGGGQKPWKQKGTGRSRHGSSRSPIWKGGGVAHGPSNEKVYSRTIPKGMRAKALMMALSRKFRDNQIIFVDSFGIESPKTSAAKNILESLSQISGFEKLGTKRKNAAIVALADGTDATRKSFRNMGNIACVAVRNLNPVTVLGSSYLIIENPEAAVSIVADRAEKKTSVAKKTK